MKRLVFFCGSGGTGKTTLAEKMEKQINYTRFQSPTRNFYALRGIRTEKELFEHDEEWRIKFQEELGDYFLERTLAFIKTSQGKSIVLERSPICHLAYLTYNNPNRSLQKIEKDLDKIVEFYKTLADMGWESLVLYFPYPTSWLLEGKAGDGFRYQQGGKDTIISALMSYYLDRVYLGDCLLDYVNLSEQDIKEGVKSLPPYLLEYP